MKHKLMQVMKERKDQDYLTGRIEIDDAYLGGRNKGGKRGRGSENKLPFFAAVQTNEENNPIVMKLRVTKGFTSHEAKKFSDRYLKGGCHLVTDGLPCFNSMAGECHSHQKVKSYQDGKFIEHSSFNWVNTVLGNLKNAIVSTYKANNKKYAQRYLSEFEYRFNRRFDLCNIFQQLLRDSVAAPAMPENLLRLAVTCT
jgi:hypothetical protein